MNMDDTTLRRLRRIGVDPDAIKLSPLEWAEVAASTIVDVGKAAFSGNPIAAMAAHSAAVDASIDRHKREIEESLAAIEAALALPGSRE